MARILIMLVAALLLIYQFPEIDAASVIGIGGKNLDGETITWAAVGNHERQKRSEGECEAGKTLRNTVMQMLRSAIEWVTSMVRGGRPDRRRPNATTSRPTDAEEMEPDSPQITDWE